jgi:hypothetical protein
MSAGSEMMVRLGPDSPSQSPQAASLVCDTWRASAANYPVDVGALVASTPQGPSRQVGDAPATCSCPRANDVPQIRGKLDPACIRRPAYESSGVLGQPVRDGRTLSLWCLVGSCASEGPAQRGPVCVTTITLTHHSLRAMMSTIGPSSRYPEHGGPRKSAHRRQHSCSVGRYCGVPVTPGPARPGRPGVTRQPPIPCYSARNGMSSRRARRSTSSPFRAGNKMGKRVADLVRSRQNRRASGALPHRIRHMDTVG